MDHTLQSRKEDRMKSAGMWECIRYLAETRNHLGTRQLLLLVHEPCLYRDNSMTGIVDIATSNIEYLLDHEKRDADYELRREREHHTDS